MSSNRVADVRPEGECDVTRAALELAERGLKIFPCKADKSPACAHGHNDATSDPEQIRKLFDNAPNAALIGVACQASGLVALDFDTHKGGDAAQWVEDHWHLLEGTRRHRTQSGGVHVIFKDPRDIDFPGQVAGLPDAEIKHRGYIVWPWSGSAYSVDHDVEPAEMPRCLLDVLDAEPGKPGGGSPQFAFTPNDASDEQLLDQVRAGENYHDALLTLGMRMANRHGLDAPRIEQALRAMVEQSQPAGEDRRRRREALLAEERGELWRMAEGAAQRAGQDYDLSDVAAAIMDGAPLGANVVSLNGHRREKPRPNSAAWEREDVMAGGNVVRLPDVYEEPVEQLPIAMETLDDLEGLHLPPIEYLVPGLIPEQSSVGIAGASNVGKTRWISALLACCITGRTDLLGFDACEPFPVLWVANEERKDDCRRRLKAFMQRNGLSGGQPYAVLGKEVGVTLARETRDGWEYTAQVDQLVEVVQKHGIKLVILDPHITLAEGGQESAEGASKALRKPLARLQNAGAATLFAHHTPKRERKADGDWYAGSLEQGFRGSGDIGAQLDVGMTLSEWWPSGDEQRKSWRKAHHDQELNHWVQLHVAKVREGKRQPVHVYHLEEQQLPEGYGIGITRLASKQEALSVLEDLRLDGASHDIAASEERDRFLAAILRAMGDASEMPWSQVCPPVAEELGLSTASVENRRDKYLKGGGSKYEGETIEVRKSGGSKTSPLKVLRA